MSDQGRLVARRYRLAEPIGRGGMGTVWRAEDQLLGRQVAVKKLRVPPELQDDELERLYERTRREARSAARITHPNVVVVHDVVEDEGLPCVVMEYVPSHTLSDVLRNDGPLEPREAARIGRGMVAALRAAHRAGVLHRDVKPANVLLGEEPDEGDEGWPGGRIVLTDFGIASATGTSTLTRTGELIGSFDYLAPERITGGTPGPASDLWALGATLYQAVEGVAPFHRDTPIETAYAIASEPLVAPRNAGALAPIIESLLRKEPERRMPAEQVERLLVSSAETVLYRDSYGHGHGHHTGTPAGSTSWAVRDDGVEGPTSSFPRQATGPALTDRTPDTPAPAPSHADSDAHAASHPPRTPDPTGTGTGTDPYGTHVAPAPGAPVPGNPAARPPAAPPDGAHGTGGPGTDAAPTHASASAERSSRNGRRRALLLGFVLGAAVLGAGTVLAQRGILPWQHTGRHTPGPTPGPSRSSTAPTGPTVPAGYHTVHESAGYSLAVPDGWSRLTKRDHEVNYISPDGKVDLKLSADKLGGPLLAHWEQLEQVVRPGEPAYHRLRMNETKVTVGGVEQDAAVWEWIWQGKLRAYHAIDLGFGSEGGTEYAVYLSAPDADWDKQEQVFETARSTFRPDS